MIFEQKGATLMKWLRRSVALQLLLISAGCSTIPFEPETKGNFREVEPAQVVEEFGGEIGQEFELLESVVFRFFGKGFTGLGYLSVEPDEPAYALNCMTPQGITLLVLEGRGDIIESASVPPQMEKHKDKIAAAIGQDLRRIYLDWLPPAGAEMKQKTDRIVFSRKIDGVKTEWVFSGENRRLSEKRFQKGFFADAIVRYFNYEEFDGKLYPMGVVLYNKQFHYRMVFRVKEIFPAEVGGSL